MGAGAADSESICAFDPFFKLKHPRAESGGSLRVSGQQSRSFCHRPFRLSLKARDAASRPRWNSQCSGISESTPGRLPVPLCGCQCNEARGAMCDSG